MHALWLTTRYREGAFEGDARLLVFDTLLLTPTAIADDVRDVLERRPTTTHIFVAAPFVLAHDLEQAVLDGAAVLRAGAGGPGSPTQFWILDLRMNQDGAILMAKPFAAREGATGEIQVVTAGEWQPLDSTLAHGWLFDLFDRHGGLVNAPVGVHFSKSSGKHSSKFLRTSNVLLTSAACGLLALVALGKIRALQPRRLFVDTSPLIAVGFAMYRVAWVRGIWTDMPPVTSFSSYGGLHGVPTLAVGDVVLISASTSGGLAAELHSRGAALDMLLTLFFLQAAPASTTVGAIGCDLTHAPERTFGYPKIDSYAHAHCPLCTNGYVLAELEGDQFLIERRAVKRLRLGATTQTRQARRFMEDVCRRKAIAVALRSTDSRLTPIQFDINALIGPGAHLEASFARLLSRFAPIPVHIVVAVDISVDEARSLASKAGLDPVLSNAQLVTSDELSGLSATEGTARNALVIVGTLDNHALLRSINSQLRSVCRGGCVAYVAALAIADSPRNRQDLRIFLSYGHEGPETFTFRSAADLMLPYVERPSTSPWTLEQQLLQAMHSDAALPSQLAQRLDWLHATGLARNGIFLPGNGQELEIRPDFVFLGTRERPEDVSQADVFAVVSNVLASARADNHAIAEEMKRDTVSPKWGQTIFYQTIVDPSNFRDFNDAVLRAALLRSASAQELNFGLDELASEEMLDVIVTEANGWSHQTGDSLPEFLIALASGRCRLTRTHTRSLRQRLASLNLPDYLHRLAQTIPDPPY